MAHQVLDMIMNLAGAIPIVGSVAFLFPDEGQHINTQVLKIEQICIP